MTTLVSSLGSWTDGGVTKRKWMRKGSFFAGVNREILVGHSGGDGAVDCQFEWGLEMWRLSLWRWSPGAAFPARGERVGRQQMRWEPKSEL